MHPTFICEQEKKEERLTIKALTKRYEISTESSCDCLYKIKYADRTTIIHRLIIHIFYSNNLLWAT